MMTQCQLDTWGTREQLCLASAVLSKGEQNWDAVSKVIGLVASEKLRPADWFSANNCASQYSRLLEGINTATQEKEGNSKTPGETINNFLTKQHIEELTELIKGEKDAYNNLYREIHHLEAGHLDHKLDLLWEQMVQEEKEEMEQLDKYNKWVKGREEAMHSSLQAHKEVISTQGTSTNNTTTADLASASPLLSTLLNRTSNGTLSTSNKEEDPIVDADSSLDTKSNVVAVVPALVTSEKESKPEPMDIDCKPLLLTASVSVKCEEEGGKCGKIEQSDAITEDTMVIVNKPEKDCEDFASAPSSSVCPDKVGYETLALSPSLPKREVNSIWDDDLKECDEVLRLGEVQRKYGRVSKYDFLKEHKDTIKLEKESDLEEEEEEEDGFAGFGPSSMSVGSRKIGSVIGGSSSQTEEHKAVDEDVYNIDNDDTIGLKATQKQKLIEEAAAKLGLHSEDSSDGKSHLEVAKILNVVPEEEDLEISSKDKKIKKNKQEDKSLDLDDCDSVDSFATNKSSVCDSDTGFGRKRKLPSRGEAASPVTLLGSPHHFSDTSPDSPLSVSYSDDPEAEKVLRAWRKSIIILYNEIASHKYASVFLKPISEERVPGYHAVVKRPMDLQTVKRNIECGHIRTTEEFQRDIMLMCTNAIIYNTKGHLHDMAAGLMVDALAKIEEFQSASGVIAPESPHKTLRRETRESLAKRSDDTQQVQRSSKKKKN